MLAFPKFWYYMRSHAESVDLGDITDLAETESACARIGGCA
jgi:hypothetical protein